MKYALTKLTTQALLEAGCYRVATTTDSDDDAQLIAFNVSGWNMYAAIGEPVILFDSPDGSTTLGFGFEESTSVEADIERLKGIIRKVKRDHDNAIADLYCQLPLLPLF